jgi:hypothetical protein
MTSDVPAGSEAMSGDDDPIIRCEIAAETLDQLRAFTSEIADIDFGCRPVARRGEQGYAMDILLPRSQIEAARASRSAAGVTITEIENATETARARQSEVAQGNRFEQRSSLPRGLGIKE